MATDDISRHLHHPAHHYTGVRAQQGRPLLDSDVNEGELLDDEDRRRDAVEILGPHGSADEGFVIGKVDRTNYDFPIHAGSYWLGGLRFEISDLAPGTPQRLKKQLNWLQQDRGSLVDPTPRPPTSDPRQDLVYLVGWEQSVTAVEDPELLELALGGPDTSTRLRRMHRVLARAGNPGPADCALAFNALVNELIAGGHAFDRQNHELLSGARLTVIPDPGSSGDLCKPALHKGYAGPENQAIRIHCSEPNRFLWSYDDTAPLYRIGVPTGKDTLTITFLTPPRDTAHYPRVGQVLEILPWGAALPNGEKVADHHISPAIGGGVYVRVVQSYDPATRQIEAREYDKKKLDNMTVWLNLRGEPDKYFYARVWNPGDDAPASGVGIPFQAAKPVPLIGTGLSVVFSNKAIPGDHWILAARPADPTNVVPWDLLGGAAPHGPRRFYCPLAMITWGAKAATAAVHSCRATIRPLTRRSRCCSVTVGDDETSFGDYKSITDALRALPADMPARICVLPGVYEERVILQNRTDLHIEGCGPRTLLRTPDGNATSKGLITITGCTRVTIRDLKLAATGQYGVMIFDDVPVDEPAFHARDITLEGLDIATTRDTDLAEPALTDLWLTPTSSPSPLSAIAAYLTEQLTIRGCTLSMGSGLSAAPCVALVRCSGVVLEDSTITATDTAWGGVHIGPNCDHVVVEHNDIALGIGHGITLGGLVVDDPAADHVHVFDPGGRTMLVAGLFGPSVTGCIPNSAPPPGGGAGAGVALADGVAAVEILANRIHNFGGSGISVLGFREYLSALTTPYEMIRADELVVADNRIYNNYNSSVAAALAAGYVDVVAFGGVVLADADAPRIRDNIITANSGRISHAVCGVYLLHGENVVVENNRILDNGIRFAVQMAGIRAGIALQLVGRRVTASGSSILPPTVEVDHLLPAARVRGNFVSQPLGRALQIYGLGPILVSSNVLVSQGLGVAFTEFDAHCVEIQNIGQSPELVEYGSVPADVAFIPAPPLLYDPGTTAEDLLVDGRILFTDNQVRFNPASTADATDVGYATRLQSYGDVGVFDNQFLVTFPSSGGTMMCDTTVTAWSTRTANNRWEDPDDDGAFATESSAFTVAAMNITALNQATRCIIAAVAAGGPSIAGTNPLGDNQTYAECEGDDEFGGLLEPPP